MTSKWIVLLAIIANVLIPITVFVVSTVTIDRYVEDAEHRDTLHFRVVFPLLCLIIPIDILVTVHIFSYLERQKTELLSEDSTVYGSF